MGNCLVDCWNLALWVSRVKPEMTNSRKFISVCIVVVGRALQLLSLIGVPILEANYCLKFLYFLTEKIIVNKINLT